MKTVYLILLFTISVVSNCLSQTYPTVTVNRPRIQISHDHFQDIYDALTNIEQSRVDTLFNSVKEGTNTFENFVTDNSLNQNAFGIELSGTTDESNWAWNFDNPLRSEQVLKLILLHYNLANEDVSGVLGIDKNLQERRLRFIAEVCNDSLSAFLANDFSECSQSIYNQYSEEFRVYSRILPYLIDWGYHALYASYGYDLRSELIEKLWEVSFNFMKFSVYTDVFPDCDNSFFAGGHSLQNNMLNLKLVTALLHSPELDSQKQNALHIRYRFLIDNLENQFIPIHKFYIDDNEDGLFGDNEGGTHWGSSYSKFSRSYWTDYFDVLTASTNIDYYDQNPWINSTINQDYFYLRPDLKTLHLGDATQFWQYENDRSIISLFNNFDNPKNKWIMKKYEEGADQRASAKIEEILLRNWLKGSVHSVTNNAPKDWYSKKTGTLVSKSSWGNDATMVTFFNPTTIRNNHQQLDANSFQIYKDGPLFVDAGVYDAFQSSHYLNFYSRTIAHNTITIFDPNEQFFSGEMANDGGQAYTQPLANFQEIDEDYDPDTWKNVIVNNDFNYSVTEASSAFNPDKVKSSVRKFFYEKHTDRIVILDYVEQPVNSEYSTVKFLAHSVNRPKTTLSQVKPVNPITKYNSFTKQFIIDNNSSRGILKSIFPSNIASTIVGGTNHKYFVFNDASDSNGTNFPPSESSEDPNKTDGAAWRLEIRKPEGTYTRKEVFINTIQLGEVNTISNNSSTLVNKNGLSVVVRWDDDLYVFSSKQRGVKNTRHSNIVSDLTSGMYSISAFDLKSNETYEVLLNNISVLEINSDDKGYLKVNSLVIPENTTSLKIQPKSGSIFKSNTPNIQNEPLESPISVYPNPTEKEGPITVLVDEVVSKNYVLAIFDIKGQEVLNRVCDTDRTIISGLKLKAGMYFIRVTDNSGVFETKLIIQP